MKALEKAFVSQVRGNHNPSDIAEAFARGINEGISADEMGRQGYMNSAGSEKQAALESFRVWKWDRRRHGGTGGMPGAGSGGMKRPRRFRRWRERWKIKLFMALKTKENLFRVDVY
jgi:hypothetical protein